MIYCPRKLKNSTNYYFIKLISILRNFSFENPDVDDWNDVCQALQNYSAKWKNISRALGITANKIQEIETNNSRNAAQCLDEALQYWIEQNCKPDLVYGLPSWRSLCHAISMVEGMKKHFKDLAKAHGGK